MESFTSRLNLARRKYQTSPKLNRCNSTIPEYGGKYDSSRTSSGLRTFCSPQMSDLLEEDINAQSCLVKPTNYPQFVLANSFVPPNETAKLWDLIARFIERRLENGKGVILPGLGILTLSSQKFQLSQDIVEHSLKPVFIVSGKFAIYHRLPVSSRRTSSDIPNVSLNFITLARILAIERDRVEMAYSEAVEKINGMLRAGRKVVLPFRGIGTLVLCLESVKMNFTSEFLARNQTTKIVRVNDKKHFRCRR
uniref:CCDC81 HU domain-containing protein n=1 Tax=Strigamia maritima TaxID=126957 RepID=T1IMW1_STRMM